MDLTRLKKEELLKIKEEIELQLLHIDTLKVEVQLSKEKNMLSSLKKNDNIFCIDFNGSKIHNMDFVKINFYKTDVPNDKNWTKFSAEHDTKPMGCSSSIRNEYMNNHCFLVEFCSSMHFYTLKPESWKTDLKTEMERSVKSKKECFNEEVKQFKNKVKNLIGSDEVDVFLAR